MKNITLLFSAFFLSLSSYGQAPAPITGGGTVLCPGSTTVLADATTGGTWITSNTAVATANLFTGAVVGVGAGTATISYTTAGGTVTTIVAVEPLPTLYHITGGGGYCLGGAGVNIGLSGSDAGIMYQLYSGTSPLGT